jgi:hypothetical protein
MFSRWYALFVGFLLIALGIAGFVAAGSLGGTQGGLVTISVLWLITGIIGLWVGFAVRNLGTLRWFAGLIGAIYFLWGIVMAFSVPSAPGMTTGGTLATAGGLNLLLGALGLSAALVPATWLHEPTPTMAR